MTLQVKLHTDWNHRHGARLDAVDQAWHLSNPAPYDPPLTFGGWNHCRALGRRIASILHAREESWNQAATVAGDSGPRRSPFKSANDNGHSLADNRGKKKKRIRHNVVIHTSPFLRCLQSSTAIAAGLAQSQPSTRKTINSESEQSTRGPKDSPHAQTPHTHLAPGLGAKDSPLSNTVRDTPRERPRWRRSKLRIDAFLGEWLNPQYFDAITPPPPSPLMVVAAKAALLHNEAVESFVPTSRGSTGDHLWSGGDETPRGRDPKIPADSSPSTFLHGRDRAVTVDSGVAVEEIACDRGGKRSSCRHGSSLQPLQSTLPLVSEAYYQPPAPNYAISSLQAPPRGYVAHARDACVDVDLEWDSSRPPQDWGGGGELGEEWSTMHRRVRHGLARLLQWYEGDGVDCGDGDALDTEQAGEDDAEEEQEDLVVVLVTHGAGCNALVGALTGQPVLFDVGMANLTVAVRRDDAPPVSHACSQDRGLRGNANLDLSAVYDLKIVSSAEHLRPSKTLSPVARLHPPQKLGFPGLTAAANGRNAHSRLQSADSASTVGQGAGDAAPASLWNAGSGLWTPSRTSDLKRSVGERSAGQQSECGVQQKINLASLSLQADRPLASSETKQCEAAEFRFPALPHNGLWDAVHYGGVPMKRRWTVKGE